MYKFGTNVIIGGNEADAQTGAVMPPIYMASTYKQKSLGETYAGYEYTRSHNPTRTRLEEALALLEGGTYALAVASGLAAESLIMQALDDGSTILASDDSYGGTYRLFTKVFHNKHKFIFADLTNHNDVQNILKTNKVDAIWIEAPTNPMLKIVDIESVSQFGKQCGAMVIVDNTFATPYCQKPLHLGADIVVHSLTKYLNGHSDIIGGGIVLNDKEFYNKLWFYQNAIGPSQSPFDSWLILRGLKTLDVRMERHCKNAQKIAEFLVSHSRVANAIYPGLSSHPQHHLATKQMNNKFGGIVTFDLIGNINTVKDFLGNLILWTLAESLGGVESLVNHPATMTHASIPELTREKLGIHDNTLRLSVGIEDADDLICDLSNALNKM